MCLLAQQGGEGLSMLPFQRDAVPFSSNESPLSKGKQRLGNSEGKGTQILRPTAIGHQFFVSVVRKEDQVG